MASSSIDEDFVGHDVQIESGFDEAAQDAAEWNIGVPRGMHAEQAHSFSGSFEPFSTRIKFIIYWQRQD